MSINHPVNLQVQSILDVIPEVDGCQLLGPNLCPIPDDEAMTAFNESYLFVTDILPVIHHWVNGCLQTIINDPESHKLAVFYLRDAYPAYSIAQSILNTENNQQLPVVPLGISQKNVNNRYLGKYLEKEITISPGGKIWHFDTGQRGTLIAAVYDVLQERKLIHTAEILEFNQHSTLLQERGIITHPYITEAEDITMPYVGIDCLINGIASISGAAKDFHVKRHRLRVTHITPEFPSEPSTSFQLFLRRAGRVAVQDYAAGITSGTITVPQGTPNEIINRQLNEIYQHMVENAISVKTLAYLLDAPQIAYNLTDYYSSQSR